MTATTAAAAIDDFEIIDPPTTAPPITETKAPPPCHPPITSRRSLAAALSPLTRLSVDNDDTTWDDAIITDLQIAARVLLLAILSVKLAAHVLYYPLYVRVTMSGTLAPKPQGPDLLSKEQIARIDQEQAAALQRTVAWAEKVDGRFIRDGIPKFIKRFVVPPFTVENPDTA
jgi:hypothetical protein